MTKDELIAAGTVRSKKKDGTDFLYEVGPDEWYWLTNDVVKRATNIEAASHLASSEPGWRHTSGDFPSSSS